MSPSWYPIGTDPAVAVPFDAPAPPEAPVPVEHADQIWPSRWHLETYVANVKRDARDALTLLGQLPDDPEPEAKPHVEQRRLNLERRLADDKVELERLGVPLGFLYEEVDA